MTKSSMVLATLVLAVSMAAAPVWAAGGIVQGDNAAGPAGSTGAGVVYTNRGDGVCDNCLISGTLSDAEGKYLLYMVQEEKLTRDVYLALYDHYAATEPLPAQTFKNISTSEQRHMDAVERLIIKCGLENPVEGDTVGVFQDTGEGFTDLYKARFWPPEWRAIAGPLAPAFKSKNSISKISKTPCKR